MPLTLKNDVMFKAVFGRENEDCKAALIGMLNLILERKDDPIQSVIYKNPFNVRETDAQKEGILDIKAETNRGELLDIEMQFTEDEEIIERNIYYHCGMVTQGLAAGEKYGKLKKTISILILNYTLPQTSQMEVKKHQRDSASIALFPESPQHLGEDKRKILWYNRRYRLKRRCRKEASIESRPRIVMSEEGRGIIDATD